jgi:hypothetical protein
VYECIAVGVIQEQSKNHIYIGLHPRGVQGRNQAVETKAGKESDSNNLN